MPSMVSPSLVPACHRRMSSCNPRRSETRWRDAGRDRGEGDKCSLPEENPQRGVWRDEPWRGGRLRVPAEAPADVEVGGDKAAAYAVVESWWKVGWDHLARSTAAQRTGVGVEAGAVVGSRVHARVGDGGKAPWSEEESLLDRR
jgi:hypothetical protein